VTRPAPARSEPAQSEPKVSKTAPARALISTVGIMVVDRSWRTPDSRWLVDEVVDEPGLGYRVWCDGELATEIGRDQAELHEWLAAHHIDAEQLQPATDTDPFCE
jgi:hypothetical protein